MNLHAPFGEYLVSVPIFVYAAGAYNRVPPNSSIESPECYSSQKHLVAKVTTAKVTTAPALYGMSATRAKAQNGLTSGKTD